MFIIQPHLGKYKIPAYPPLSNFARKYLEWFSENISLWYIVDLQSETMKHNLDNKGRATIETWNFNFIICFISLWTIIIITDLGVMFLMRRMPSKISPNMIMMRSRRQRWLTWNFCIKEADSVSHKATFQMIFL